jgi:hypothetical protein
MANATLPSITCAHCRTTHHSVEAVRACFAGATITSCTWLVQRGYDEDGGEIILDCGAEAIVTDCGFECDAGHSHATAEVRDAEGWDYAEDRDEALALTKAGVFPVQMDGHAFV